MVLIWDINLLESDIILIQMLIVLEITLDLETTIQNESIDHSVFLENESRLTSDTDMAFQFVPHLLESEAETRP